MEKVESGLDCDRHVVTYDRVLIKSKDLSPQPAWPSTYFRRDNNTLVEIPGATASAVFKMRSKCHRPQQCVSGDWRSLDR